jgi:hypothetical protein
MECTIEGDGLEAVISYLQKFKETYMTDCYEE